MRVLERRAPPANEDHPVHVRAEPSTEAADDEPGTEGSGHRGRLVGLDVLRGLLIAAVVVLEVVGVPEHPHLAHAAWDGLTVTDLVFPSLIVVSGVSLAFLLKQPAGLDLGRRVLRRSVALILVGVFLVNNAGSLDLEQVRLTGVLQTFAVAGLAASIVVLVLRGATRRDRWWVVALLTAVGVALYQSVFLRAQDAMMCADDLGHCSPFHHLDVSLLGESHVYRAGNAGWDPEGIVPALAATLLMLAGWSIGALLRDRDRVPRWLTAAGLLAVSGVLLLLAAPTLGEALPVNKRLHTPAFQVTTIGWTFALLAGLVLVFDTTVSGRAPVALTWARKAVAWPLEALGRNPLTMYVLAHLLTVAAESNTLSDGRTWREAFTDRAVEMAGGVWWGDPLFNAAFGLLVVVFAVAVAMRTLGWRIAL